MAERIHGGYQAFAYLSPNPDRPCIHVVQGLSLQEMSYAAARELCAALHGALTDAQARFPEVIDE